MAEFKGSPFPKKGKQGHGLEQRPTPTDFWFYLQSLIRFIKALLQPPRPQPPEAGIRTTLAMVKGGVLGVAHLASGSVEAEKVPRKFAGGQVSSQGLAAQWNVGIYPGREQFPVWFPLVKPIYSCPTSFLSWSQVLCPKWKPL